MRNAAANIMFVHTMEKTTLNGMCIRYAVSLWIHNSLTAILVLVILGTTMFMMLSSGFVWWMQHSAGRLTTRPISLSDRPAYGLLLETQWNGRWSEDVTIRWDNDSMGSP